MKSRRNSKKLVSLITNNKTLICIIIIAALILSIRINFPWIGHHDWNGARFAGIARNYLTYGYLTTKLGQVVNSGLVSPDRFVYYINHPPLLPLLLSFSFFVFGESEWSARLVPIVFSLGSILLVFLIVRKLWDKTSALYASFLMVFLPMFAYFGRMVNHEALTLFFVLSVIYSYLLWLDAYNRKYFLLMSGGLVLGFLVDWPAAYIVPILLLHYFVSVRGRNKLILVLPAIPVILFILFLWHSVLLKGSVAGGDLFRALLFRLNLSGTEEYYFSISQFIRLEAKRVRDLFTPLVGVLSVVWLIRYLIDREKLKNTSNFLVFLLFIFGSIHILIFPNGAWIHDYWLFYLIPAFAISAALSLDYLAKSITIEKKTILICIIMAVFIIEAIPLIKFLYNVDINPYRYKLGVFIRSNSKPSESVMASIDSFGPHSEYYARRNIKWGINNINDFLKTKRSQEGNYSLFVTEKDETNKELYKYLVQHYKYSDKNDYWLFYLKQKK